MIDASWYMRPPGVPDRTSAGGIVARVAGGRVLVALVRERELTDWIVPKGGRKRGETLLEAARREIHEEAGFTELRLVGKIAVAERLDFKRREWITAHYYLFLTRQVEARPIDRRHHYGTSWFPLGSPPRMFWPEQALILRALVVR